MSAEEFKDTGDIEHNEHFGGDAKITLATHNDVNNLLAWANLWSAVGAFSYGFGASIISSSLGQPNFYKKFPYLITAPNLTQILGAIVTLLGVGGIVAGILNSYVMTKWGRKMAFLVNSFFFILGTCLSGGAANYIMFIMSRFVLGIGAWGYVGCAVIYAQELAPATRRGQLGGAVGVALAAGYITASWVGVGFYFMKSESNWRVPILMSLIGPLIILSGYPFVPESPRWLAWEGRDEECLATLIRIHGTKSDPDNIVAREEHYQIIEQTKIDKSLPHSWGSLFTTYRRRLATACLINFCYGSTGVGFLSSYGPIIYGKLGFTPMQSLLLVAGANTWSLLLNCVCAGLVDKTGRRPMLIGSIGGTGLILIIFVCLQRFNPDGTNIIMGRATVATFFIYSIPYSFCEPVVFLYNGEVFSNHIRTKGGALVAIFGQLNGVWPTMGQPTAVAHIHYKFYILFVVFCIFGAITMYFVVPETRHVPLEEIAALFNEEVAVRAADITIDEKTQQVKVQHHV